MKAPKAATGPTAAGTRTYVSYQQGHWGQPQGMCDIWHKGKRIAPTVAPETVGATVGASQRATAPRGPPHRTSTLRFRALRRGGAHFAHISPHPRSRNSRHFPWLRIRRVRLGCCPTAAALHPCILPTSVSAACVSPPRPAVCLTSRDAERPQHRRRQAVARLRQLLHVVSHNPFVGHDTASAARQQLSASHSGV